MANLMLKRRVGAFGAEEELLLGFQCIASGEGVGLGGAANPTYETATLPAEVSIQSGQVIPSQFHVGKSGLGFNKSGKGVFGIGVTGSGKGTGPKGVGITCNPSGSVYESAFPST